MKKALEDPVVQKVSRPMISRFSIAPNQQPNKPTPPPTPARNPSTRGPPALPTRGPTGSRNSVTGRTSGGSYRSSGSKNKTVTYATTKEEVLDIIDKALNKVLVVDFYAMWCPPCHLIEKLLEDLGEKYKDLVLIVRVNVDELEDYALETGVTTLPTLLFMRNKTRLDMVSSSNLKHIRGIFEKYVDKDGVQNRN